MSEEKVVQLPEGEYARYLAELAAGIADEKAQKREVKWRAALGLGITVVTLLGVSNFRSIQTSIDEKLSSSTIRLETKIDQQIPAAVKSYITNNKVEVLGDTISSLQLDLESRMALLQLVIIASEMTRGNGFTQETQLAVVALLKEVSSNPHLVNSDQFTKPLEDIVDSFMGADQETYIDDIDSKLREVISERSGIVSSMLQHYGLRVLGGATLDNGTVERFLHYSKLVMHAFDSPERVAPFMLGYEFFTSGGMRTKTSDAIFEDVKHWSEEDRKYFTDLIGILSEGRFVKIETGKTKRVQSIMNGVVELYGEEIIQIRQGVSDGQTDSLENIFRALLQSENILE